MQLRTVHRARRPGAGDNLATLDLVAFSNHQLAVVRIGCDIAIGVADQDQLAIAIQLTAGIDNLPGSRCAHLGSVSNLDIDTVIAAALGGTAKTGDDTSTDRPVKARRIGSWLGPLDTGVACIARRIANRAVARRRCMACPGTDRQTDLLADFQLVRRADSVVVGELLKGNIVAQADPVEVFTALHDMNRRPGHVQALPDPQSIGAVQTIGIGKLAHRHAAMLCNFGQCVAVTHLIAIAAIAANHCTGRRRIGRGVAVLHASRLTNAGRGTGRQASAQRSKKAYDNGQTHDVGRISA